MSFEREVIEAEFRTVSSSKTLKEIESISNAILKLKRETDALEKKKKEAAVQYGANSKQVKELTSQIKANNAQLSLQKSKLEDANKKLKVSEMSSRQLKDRMAELKRAMEGVNKEAFPDRWNKLNKAYQETDIQLKKMSIGSNSVKKGIGSMMTYAKGLLPAFGFSAIAGGVLSLSKELFQLSIQMKSDSIRNTTIFGDALKYVEAQAALLSKSMGLTNREFVSNAASSADLLKPLGFTSEQAAKLSVKMQELAGPLAEWSKGKYNAAQITEVMNGALTGEMERLKGLGIIIQQSSPEYMNLVKLKQKEESCTLDQAKALAALELMYQKSTDAQNAYIAGGNKLSRTWNGLKASVREFKEKIVEAFDETIEERLTKQTMLVNSLSVKLTDANTSEAERVQILSQLKNINPQIVEGLNAENISVQALKKNLSFYNDEIAKTIALENLSKEERSQQVKLADKMQLEANASVNFSDAMEKLNPNIALDKNLTQQDKFKKILSGYSKEDISFSSNSFKYNVQSRTGTITDTRTEEQKALGTMITQYNLLIKYSQERQEIEKVTESITTRIEKIKNAISGDEKKEPGKKELFTDDEKKNQKTILSKSSTVEQANADYKKQLTDAGLFGKKREELTGDSLRALEAIEKSHRDTIAKLDRDAISKYLDTKNIANQKEITDLQIKQNTELASIKNLEDAKRVLLQSMSVEELNNIQTIEQARKSLANKYNKEERETTRRQAEELTNIITDIQDKKKVEGLKLADNIISEEESKLLQERLQRAQDSLSKISASEAQTSMELVSAREKAYADATKAAMTLIEQENQAYNERLRACGLFGKTKGELTGETLRTLEALEKAHQKKLNEIDKTAIVNFINKKQSAFQQELINLKTKQNEEYASIKTFHHAKKVLAQSMSDVELSEINTMGEARKALQAKYVKENRQMVIRQTSELLGILKSVTDGENVPDLKLADQVLSEEESQELQERISKAKAAIAGLLFEEADSNAGNVKESGVDLLGMSPERWQTLFDNLADGKVGIEDMQSAAGALMDMWGIANDFLRAKENQALKEFENNTKEKKKDLALQLDAGKIRQEEYTARVAQLDADLDAKKEEISQKQAKREKKMAIVNTIINTALSISKTASAIPFPICIPFIAAAAALGAVQLATITAQPDKFKKGGFTSSSSSDDEEAGVVHANEFVASAQAVRNPTVLPVLKMIDKAQREGTIRTLDLSELPRQSGFRSGGFTSPPASEIQEFSFRSANDTEIKELLRRNIDMMQAVIDKEITIPWYGQGGIAEKMGKAQKYEQKTTVKP